MIDDNPRWYKDAVIYEVHVKTFFDSDGDGMGDFKGLTEKLDYLQQLGVTAIWLLPFYPSPLRDDGYDISDYYNVHPLYGDIKDFKLFLREAHKRGLRAITELVINHTSDQHPWFQRARKAKPGSSYRNYYVWSDTPEKYTDARIIFKDFEHSNWSYDPVAKSYYWHRFYHHQPDLNFDNPGTIKAVFKALDYWFGLGVDGLRLDAVPYLYEREGTDCENLEETHDFLKKLRKHVDSKFKNRMLLAEANQWPEDAAAYFGDGGECHMNFHFPLMPRLFMAVRREDRTSIIDILDQTPQIHENCQWALFLRNHDELTLEMVTDEERDYMYRVYAEDYQARINLGIRRRLSPLLRKNRRLIELLYALLFSLPGTPVIYYGDEMGMGDNIHLGDRNGVRTPMQWSSDKNAGFSKANPQGLYLPVIIDPDFHYETLNVESQLGNPNSLLRWTKRLIGLRKRFKAFGRGSIEFLHPGNKKVLAFIRKFEDEKILILANLSRYVQFVKLDLQDYEDYGLTELFSRNEFPKITNQPYMFTIGPHSFYWFELAHPTEAPPKAVDEIPQVQFKKSWMELFKEKLPKDFEFAIRQYLLRNYWFEGKNYSNIEIEFYDAVFLDANGLAEKRKGKDKQYCLFQVSVKYSDAETERYNLPVGLQLKGNGQLPEDIAKFSIARAVGDNADGIIYDAVCDLDFSKFMLKVIRNKRQIKGKHGRVFGERMRRGNQLFNALKGESQREMRFIKKSNTSIIYDELALLKWYRKIEEGINPDVELSKYLSNDARFHYSPPLAGVIDYKIGRKKPVNLCSMRNYYYNIGDSWRFIVDELDRFFDRAATYSYARNLESLPDEFSEIQTCKNALEVEQFCVPQQLKEMFNLALDSIEILGIRTAEMHIRLAKNETDPFIPERFTPFYRRSLYQSMRNTTTYVLEDLNSAMKEFNGDESDIPTKSNIRGKAEIVIEAKKQILSKFYKIIERQIPGYRIRIHGDFFLSNVLCSLHDSREIIAGRDFLFIDFEGETGKSIEERRLKRNPLRDVASMILSLNSAAYYALENKLERISPNEQEVEMYLTWTRLWQKWVSSQFLTSYLRNVNKTFFFRELTSEQICDLLSAYRLERAVYELGSELRGEREFLHIPLAMILDILQEQ